MIIPRKIQVVVLCFLGRIGDMIVRLNILSIIKLKLTKDKIIFIMFFLTCFLIHLIPRFLVANWFVEEEFVYMIVESLMGNNPEYAGFYPSLTQRMVVGFSFFGFINPEIIAKIINPLFATLTLIPIYFLVKNSLTKNQTYTVLLFWAFSEAVFYRTAHFSSTEAVSFFFAILALALYQQTKIKYGFGLVLGCLGLSLWSHVLPAVIIAGTIFIHKFLFSGLKGKIIGLCLIIGVGLILFSSFSPHLRVIDVGNPITMLSNLSISNLFLYSITELFFGIKIFSGLLILLLLSIPMLILKPKNHKILLSLLIVSILIFIFSWIAYSPQIFAPPRLTLYFVIPLSYYATLTIWKIYKTNKKSLFIVGLIVTTMLISIFSGLQPMLWIDNAMTKYEYQALQDNKDIITDVYDWWCDYPVRIAITRITLSNIKHAPTNETKAIIDSEIFRNYSATVTPNNANIVISFKYVFYSERMSKEGLFIMYYGEGRSKQIREPIPNIWETSPFWKLVYNNTEVKIYERVD